jgi:hypothetical protein
VTSSDLALPLADGSGGVGDGNGPARAERLLREACERLLPVVLEIGPERLRMTAYVDEAGAGSAVLSQLPTAALPPGRARLRVLPATDDERWCVLAEQDAVLDADSLRIDLSRARVEDLEPSALEHATDLLVMVVPGGLHDSTSYVFPVTGVGATECEIRASLALPPGHEIEHVEIVGDRRLLRRARAQVVEVLPWYQPDGAPCFSLRLALGELPADHEAKRRAHDLVTTASDVLRLLRLGAMMRTGGWFEAPGCGRGVLDLVELGKDSALFEVKRALGPTLLGSSIRIGLPLFATDYELDVRVIEVEAERVRTTLPLILRRRRRHRRDHRVPVGRDQLVDLMVRNPVTGGVQVFPVSEVSFFGIEVGCPPHGAVLWRGLPLEQAQLRFGPRLVHLGDVVVEELEANPTTGWVQCVIALQSASIADDPDMIALLATLAHPHVRVHDGRDFDGLHATYLRAGLFGPHMHRNLEPILEQTRGVWRRLHSGAADVVRTFVHGKEEQPDAAVTVMRAWEHAWVLQHFVDTSSERSGATGRLQSAYLDHLVPRPDARYLLFFVKTDNHIMNAYLRRFFDATGTPEAVTRSQVELWIGGGVIDVGEPDPELQIRPMEASDEPLVQRAAQRYLGGHAAAALSLIEGELTLPDTHARFARAGLERGRTSEVVCRDGRPVYALIEEQSTPGVNLTWMLNASWILPLESARAQDEGALRAALRAVNLRPPQAATGERFLNLPRGLNERLLQEAGFTREAALYLYVLNRAGLHRFLHYAAERYGEVDAIAQRRRTRGARSEPSARSE